MKKDIDRLMRKNNVTALWISGAANHNSAMVYLTGGVHVTGADLFYRPGKKPVLFHGPMERDEAAKTGYRLVSYADYPYKDYLKQASNDMLEAQALRYRQILSDIGLTSGKVYLYGVREIGGFFATLKRLQELFPDLELTGDLTGAILLEARATKSAEEIERIREMGKVTVKVVGNTLDFLTSHKVKGETLVKNDGSPLLLGEVKSRINLWLAECGAENPAGTIFAIGRDAGVPHSSGEPTDPIVLGKTIVYDIFPCELGGGYFYDFTRTWSLGYATDEVLSAYEQVKKVYDTVTSELKAGVNFAHYQARTCELFEKMGHETVRQNPRIEQGYVHGLGHGVGLDVHEKPNSGSPEDPTHKLQPGSVITIEPGLYYPKKGFGIRLEDSYYVAEDKTFHKFVDFPMDLVIPMKRKVR